MRAPRSFFAVHGRAILLAVALPALAGGYSAHAIDGKFTTHDSDKLLSLEGAWTSRGYGYVWHVNRGRVTEYEQSGSYCIAVANSDGMPDGAGDQMVLDTSRQVMRIGVADDIGYLHTFDRRAKLPEACRREPDRSPQGIFDAVDQIFRAQYAFFQRRKIDWPSIVDTFRPRLREQMTDAELFTLISEMLNTTGDAHVTLRATMDGKRRWFSAKGKPISAPPGPTSSQLLPGRWSSAAALGLLGPAAQHNITGSIIYGLIDGEIGYLNVRSLWWRRIPDLDDTLDKALALFQRARMVIVDVSVNGGGGEGLGMRVVERFAGARTLGFYKYAGDGRDEKPQPIFVVPSKKARFLGPAYVITSGETFSAAETLAMSMSVLPNVVHLGQPTAGALSDVLSRRLPNGWRVGLSNEIYLDVARKSWEGIGVPPTVGLEIRPDLKTASPGDLKAARAVLNAIIARAKSKATGRD